MIIKFTVNILEKTIKAMAAASLLMLPTTMACAETWIARCNNLQFNFNRTAGTYLLYFNTSTGIFQIGKGTITFDNGTALRGPLTGNSFGTDGEPITQIGINISRGLVYVLYRHPTDHTTKTGDFCSTTIQRS